MSLAAAVPVLVPALVTLRIIDGRQGRAETLSARVRAFHLTTEEARTAPNVVTGMFQFIIVSIILWYAYVYAFDW